jgi:[ribosomal protein S5]-alanine N-acetyltransferase
MQPDVDTTRLRLRPAQRSDLDMLWALWVDPDVRRFLWDDRAITRDEAAATLDDCVALGAKGLGLWIVAPRAEGGAAEPIGCAGLQPVSVAVRYEPRLAGLVEPLVALAPRAWRRGWAHEALAALIAYASARLGLGTLAAVTDVPNVASDRMLRRAGFIPLGETPGPRHAIRTYLREAGAAT